MFGALFTIVQQNRYYLARIFMVGMGHPLAWITIAEKINKSGTFGQNWTLNVYVKVGVGRLGVAGPSHITLTFVSIFFMGRPCTLVANVFELFAGSGKQILVVIDYS